MHPGARSICVVVSLVCCALLAGCTAEPEKPTLEEAAKHLISDGDKLLGSFELRTSGQATATKRADTDESGSCTPDEVQRFFRAAGDFTGPANEQLPFNAVGLMQGKLESMGYDEVVDDLDLRDQNLGVSVLHNPETGLTFVLTARTAQKPNIVLVGKTGCYKRSG
ncbi:hypothetical protein [Streptosporangium sp. KLBMP 9127]|nr:hypothetical protein [Streptosporangium sp. KLBMP 9127]